MLEMLLPPLNRYSVFLCALFFLLPRLVAGEETSIQITSQKMTIKNSQNLVIFEENVHVTQGDLIIQADRVEVSFHSSPESIFSNRSGDRPPPKEVSSIAAFGGVRLTQGGRRATAQQMVYYREEEKVVLTGNPEAWEEDYKVTGTRMTFFLKEDRSVVEGSKVVIRQK